MDLAKLFTWPDVYPDCSILVGVFLENFVIDINLFPAFLPSLGIFSVAYIVVLLQYWDRSTLLG